MPKVKFVENKFIEPPYTGMLATFSNYGEEKELPETSIIRLLTDHPYAFTSKDVKVSQDSEQPKENQVAIKFIRNKYLDAYNYSKYFFKEAGEVQYVDEADARYMLTTHPDKFELVDEDKKKDEFISENEEANDDDSSSEAEKLSIMSEAKSILDAEDISSFYEVVKRVLGDSKMKISTIADELGVDWQSIRSSMNQLVSENKLVVTEELEDNGTYKAKMYSVVK
jgi:hypothetical protein